MMSIITANYVKSALAHDRKHVHLLTRLLFDFPVEQTDNGVALFVEHVEKAVENFEMERGRQQSAAGLPSVAGR